jgi:BCD family chlorophyll transporter-like MFS transporter
VTPRDIALARFWNGIGARLLPFADAASTELPLGRLLRLSLFQVSVGMAVVLLTGTLNRVMIVELGVSAWLVALMVALPLLFAPMRALIGYQSDTYRSYLGWRRVPYIWYGTLFQFGGLAIMPFALLVLGGDIQAGALWWGHVGGALAFLMVGAGLHTTQTAGLALATDLAPEDKRPRVVAMLYVMFLIGMVFSALALGWLLADFTPKRLIQVVQGAAILTFALNMIALWKQEARDPARTAHHLPKEPFLKLWRGFSADGRAKRLLVAVGLGAAGFSMQDILLEPYGAEILGLSVSATTLLTALLAGGTLAGLGIASKMMKTETHAYRLAGYGAVVGVFAFAAVVYAAPLDSPTLFRVGTAFIGLGGGLFIVGTMTAAMALTEGGNSGIAVGAWGAVHATATGVAVATGGFVRDVFGGFAADGHMGAALADPSVGYMMVYHVEILLLFMALVAIGPLARPVRRPSDDGALPARPHLGLSEFPS